MTGFVGGPIGRNLMNAADSGFGTVNFDFVKEDEAAFDSIFDLNEVYTFCIFEYFPPKQFLLALDFGKYGAGEASQLGVVHAVGGNVKLDVFGRPDTRFGNHFNVGCRTGKVIGLFKLEYYGTLQVVGVGVAPQPVGAVINGRSVYESVGKRIICRGIFVVGFVRGQICLVGNDVFERRAVEVNLFTKEQTVVFGGVGNTNVLCFDGLVKLELNFVGGKIVCHRYCFNGREAAADLGVAYAVGGDFNLTSDGDRIGCILVKGRNDLVNH